MSQTIPLAFMFGVLFGMITTVHPYFNSKFEPPDGRAIHGLGQYVPVDYDSAENWQMVTDYQNAITHVPVIYSVYAAIDSSLDSLDPLDYVEVTTQHGYPYALLIGLFLTDSTRTNIPADDYLTGKLDDQIIKLASRIKSIENTTPVFLRPGFEFGPNNDGIHEDPDLLPDEFIQIWLRIYDIFQQQNVTNVAWVWNTVNPNKFTYMDWYPGDNYVDWFGINVFTTNQMSNSANFLSDALTRGKPVIICESNPITDGGTTNSDNWNDWFVPYFDYIENNAHIKAFVYISDPWTKGSFSHWPDSEIDSDSTIQTNYKSELDDAKYIHMQEYQQYPGIIDSPLPITLTEFRVSIRSDFNLIEWITESEINNLGFHLYRAESEVELPEDELNFIRLNSVIIPGAGNSNIANYYEFKDLSVQDGKFYWYQLEDVSYDGKRTKHQIVKIYRDDQGHTPNSFALYQTFPNPFNSNTIIMYQIPEPTPVQLSIYNVLGELVHHVRFPLKDPGTHEYDFTAETENGIPLPSGQYIYQVITKNGIDAKRMILLR